MQTTPFRVNADPIGAQFVEVDGRDITNSVRALSIVAAVDEPTRLTIELAPGAAGVVEGEGIVEVVRDGVSGDLVRALDPAAVRDAVLRRASGGVNTAAIYLDVIAAMLDRAG